MAIAKLCVRQEMELVNDCRFGPLLARLLARLTRPLAKIRVEKGLNPKLLHLQTGSTVGSDPSRSFKRRSLGTSRRARTVLVD